MKRIISSIFFCSPPKKKPNEGNLVFSDFGDVVMGKKDIATVCKGKTPTRGKLYEADTSPSNLSTPYNGNAKMKPQADIDNGQNQIGELYPHRQIVDSDDYVAMEEGISPEYQRSRDNSSSYCDEENGNNIGHGNNRPRPSHNRNRTNAVYIE